MARVLVVDDDHLERTFAARVMAAGKHQVVFAEDGEAAMSLYRSGGFDVVVTDLAMPRLNGLRLIQELVEMDSNVRIIAVSGLNSDQLLIAEDYGANHLLPKPWSAGDMLEAIARVTAGPPVRSAGWRRRHDKALAHETGVPDDCWY